MRPHRFPAPLLTLLFLGLPLASPVAAQVCDFPPRMQVSAASGALGVPAYMTVTVLDPNDDPITSLTANTSQLPGGTVSFTRNADNTSGTLSWIAPIGFSGTYPVSFTATNGLTGMTSASFTVLDTNGFPIVQCPAFIQQFLGGRIQFPVYAGDPDGEPIQSLTVAPSMPGLTFSTNASNTMGSFDWQTSLAGVGEGTYPFTFTVTTSAVRSFTTNIQLITGDPAPVIQVPGAASGTEGQLLTICVEAYAPDGGPLDALLATGLPPGATFTSSPSHLAGTFSWTPAAGQAGSYSATFQAFDEGSSSTASRVSIVIRAVDGAPVVTAPAAQTVEIGSHLTFDVTASDPDGDPILSLSALDLPGGATFVPNFDNTIGTFGWAPAFGQGGTWFVRFEATSDVLTSSATTAITVTGDTGQARVFTRAGNGTIRLASGKSTWCANVEPVGGSFQVGDVVPGSIVLVSPGTGRVSQIPAVPGKGLIAGDADRNTVEDVEACFAKDDLRDLFSNLSGRGTYTVTVRGDLATGDRFLGYVNVEVVATAGNMVALVPNPPHPTTSIQFRTSRAGPVRARVFDIRGRLVRTLDAGAAAVAGEHALAFDGRGDSGKPLPSGIYLFRIETPDGDATTKAAILR